MTTEREEIVLRGRDGITTAALDEIKLWNPDTCAGTFKKMPDGCELPCGGGGLSLKKFERLVITRADQEPVETIRPIQWQVCPCIKEKEAQRRLEKICEAFGIGSRTEIEPHPEQAIALARYTAGHRSFFVYGGAGGGKTVLAAACAMKTRGQFHVLVADEIAAEWRRMAFENEAPEFEGTVFLDDMDKVTATDSLKAKVWYLIDRADKEKVRLFITTNLEPKAFAEKFTAGREEAQSLIRRLTKFELVQL